MKRKVILVVFSLILIFMMGGCGEKEELETTPSQSLDELISIGSETEKGECPEGYVYDYQVSMEPIPEDIAALGGDVYGTIHAYPSRIEIALTEKEIEEDSELKKENERNVQAIQKYLSDTYGGEFEIVPFETGIWSYLCTEKNTGKCFNIYVSSLYGMGVSEDVVAMDTYYYEENIQEYLDEIDIILKENISNEYYYKSKLQRQDDVNVLYINLAIFDENDVDYIDEQKRIISIYSEVEKMLSDNNSEADLALNIIYINSLYKDVIAKQYQSNNYEDVTYIYEQCAEKLISEKEILAKFEFHETGIFYNENELEKLSEEQEVNKNKDYILPYWKGIK